MSRISGGRDRNPVGTWSSGGARLPKEMEVAMLSLGNST